MQTMTETIFQTSVIVTLVSRVK